MRLKVPFGRFARTELSTFASDCSYEQQQKKGCKKGLYRQGQQVVSLPDEENRNDNHPKEDEAYYHDILFTTISHRA
jgi:hypothetical protein